MAEKMITSSCGLSIFLLSLALISVAATVSPDPVPAPWPLQFHALLIMNYTDTDNGLLELNNLWYDWPNGRNFQIIQNQLGVKYYAYEWNNGTTFYFTLDEDGNSKACHNRRFPIGILRPNWLNGANYLGQAVKDGFLCNVWEKVEFVWYYEDVVSKIPVYWEFYNGLITHVMTFEVGKVLDESDSQAPAYCFEDGAMQESKPILEPTLGFPVNPSSMRDIPSNPIVI